MGDRKPELVRRIEAELANYPVTFKFGQGGTLPFVELFFAGKSEKVRYCFSADVGHSWYNCRSDLRKAARKLGADRVGALGHKIIEAARAPSLAEQVFGPKKPPAEEPIPCFAPGDRQLELKPLLSVLRPRPQQPEAEAKPMATQTIQHTNGRSNGTDKAEAETLISKLTNSESVAITRHIMLNADIDSVKGTLTYKPGWSDERILKILQATPGRDHLKLVTVQKLRKQELGRLPSEIEKAPRRSSSEVAISALEDKVAALTVRVEALEGAVTAPTKGVF